MKFKIAILAMATVSASGAYAGGMEVTRLPTAMASMPRFHLADSALT